MKMVELKAQFLKSTDYDEDITLCNWNKLFIKNGNRREGIKSRFQHQNCQS